MKDSVYEQYAPLGLLAAEEAMRTFTRYTLGPGNLDRVVGLATDDVVGAVRPHIERAVREYYEAYMQMMSQRAEGAS